MIAAYLTDLISVAGRLNPLGLVASLALPGRARAWQLADPSSPLHSFFVVEAASFTDLDSVSGLVRLPGAGAKFSDLVKSWDGAALSSLPLAGRLLINTKLAALNLSNAGDLGAIARRIMLRLEPNSTDDLFEKVIPEQGSSITDDFNRASLGAGWELVSGATAWETVGSVTARPTDNFATTATRRTESSFPNDQYAQGKCEFTTTGDYSRGAVAIRLDGSGNGYYLVMDTNNVALQKIVGGVDTYIADSVVSASANTLYTLKLQATGTTLLGYFEGAEKINTTDSAHSGGKPGMLQLTGDAAQFSDHDDFECTDATASGGASKNLLLLGVG